MLFVSVQIEIYDPLTIETASDDVMLLIYLL